MTPFEIANHIFMKTDVEVSDGDLNPWILNRVMSNHFDCIFYADAMNRCASLPKDIQYDFYFHGISKGKRFAKWNKKEESDSELINTVCETYCVNKNHAIDIIKLLTDEQQKQLKEMRGGK